MWSRWKEQGEQQSHFLSPFLSPFIHHSYWLWGGTQQCSGLHCWLTSRRRLWVRSRGLCPSFLPQSKDMLHNRLIGHSKLPRSVSANGWWCLRVGPAVTWQLDPEHSMNWVGVDPLRETNVPCLKHFSLRCLLTYKLDIRQRNVFLETKITHRLC